MWSSLLPLALVQSALLAGGQVLLKFATNGLSGFAWTWSYVGRVLTNGWLLGCGLCYAAASLLWLYMIKHYPFSMAYPMISLSYVFGMLAAWLIFHEEVTWTSWMGVALIMGGCILIAR
jgi:undecaprenyl phosphate-alpha-L-ara4N flippase subunit ArnE